MHCSAEWHLVRLKTRKMSSLIYSLALRLTGKSGVFRVSVGQLAKYLHSSDRTVRRALKALVDSGFFQVISSAPGLPVAYRPVSHGEWAAAHPRKCYSTPVLFPPSYRPSNSAAPTIEFRRGTTG